MNLFDSLSGWFLALFPNGGEVLKLFGVLGHTFTGAFALWICFVVFGLTLRILMPGSVRKQFVGLPKEVKSSVGIMQGVFGLGFSLQVGYLIMREPRVSFALCFGIAYIVLMSVIFLIFIRIARQHVLRDVIFANKISSAFEIGLYYLSWSIISLFTLASRY